MKHLATLAAAVLVLASCQDATQPAGPDAPTPVLSRSAGTVDVIVALDENFAPGAHAANEARAAEIARDLGVTPELVYGTALFGFAAIVPEARLNGLRNDPRVDYVDFDRPVSLPNPIDAMEPPCFVSGTCNSDGGSSGQTLPWGINRVDADVNTNEGAGIHVYVIDTGIDSDHPDLQAHLGNGYAATDCKGGSCNTAWDDDNGHGTHVSGTIGAIDNDIDVVGIASQVTLHAVKVLDSRGSGSFSDVIAGIDWTANETAMRGEPSVANMSLGASGSKDGECTDSGYTGTDSFYEAICNATNVGVVFAVAAGNDDADADSSVPAAFDDAVISVSATECSFSTSSGVQSCTDGSDGWASFSNWGNDTAGWDTDKEGPHAPVALGAPGVDILSTWNDGGTNTISGTSMATPHVAGAIALFLNSSAQSPDYSAFTNARSTLLGAEEEADAFADPDDEHDEDFLNAEAL